MTLLYFGVFGVYRLRWLTSQKTDDAEKKCSFLRIKDLKPLNTCKKYFESILLNLPLGKC